VLTLTPQTPKPIRALKVELVTKNLVLIEAALVLIAHTGATSTSPVR
jgi:hypothetical protein